MNSSAAQAGFEILLPDEAATIALGKAIADAVLALHRRDALPLHALVIYLVGDLGAGKTTMSRGIVRGFGHSGAVKSPTFTLVEPYALSPCAVYHFDLYRINDAEEFEYIGVDNYFGERNAVCLLEWPERGEGIVPQADLTICLGDMPRAPSLSDLSLETGAQRASDAAGRRNVTMRADGSTGAALLEELTQQCKTNGLVAQTGAARANRPA